MNDSCYSMSHVIGHIIRVIFRCKKKMGKKFFKDIDLDSIEKIEAPVQVVEPTKTAPAPVQEQQQTSEPEETTVKTTTTEETVIQAEHVKTTTETTTVEATKTTETTVITSTEDPKEPEVIQGTDFKNFRIFHTV